MTRPARPPRTRKTVPRPAPLSSISPPRTHGRERAGRSQGGWRQDGFLAEFFQLIQNLTELVMARSIATAYGRGPPRRRLQLFRQWVTRSRGVRADKLDRRALRVSACESFYRAEPNWVARVHTLSLWTGP